MSKPWAKYEVGFINHTKFRALNANAICLWLEGKNFADAHFTDGMLPAHEVEHWKYYSKKAVLMLTASCGQRADNPADTYAPLWEVIAGVGFRMHDYLDHNDCREKAVQRIFEQQVKRQADRDRLAKWRANKKAKHDAIQSPETPPETPDETVLRTGNETDVTPMKRSDQNTEYRIQKELSLEQRVSQQPSVGEVLGARGAALVERYQVLYTQERHGAHYRPRPNLDWLDACDLCRHWDDARLDKLARLVLTTDDAWIAKTDRSFKIFAMKASAMDDRLAAWEAEQLALGRRP